MKSTLRALLLTGGFVAASAASAATSTFQYCNTSGCQAGGSKTVTSNYAQTKYPLVFAHGMAGFSAIGGAYGYWYGIPENLAANGAQVFVTQVASFNSSEVRGEQLLTQVKQILAITGSDKVNLIGHSHGVQSVRYIAGLLPNQVASVTGVAGPNKGSPVADNIQLLVNSPVGPVIAPVISGAVNAFFTLVGVSSGQYYSQDSLAGLNSLTSTGTAAFNTKFPQGIPTTACGQGANAVNGIRYYSWGGTGVVTNLLNPASALLLPTSLLISGPSDGLVPKCSSHLGQVIRDDYFQNHLDEVNQVLGLVSPFEVSPVTLFRQQASRLKTAGL